MMVDTINPNTNEPDVLGQAPIGPTSVAQTGETRFYGGFDKPEDVKINLANDAVSGQATSVPIAQSQPQSMPPISTPLQQSQAPIANDVTPGFNPSETTKHDTYSTVSEPVNVRGLLVIIGAGLLLTIIAGVSTYFIVGAMNSSKITAQQTQIDKLSSDLAALNQTPSALELPSTSETTTPAATETPAVPVTPAETPAIETPVPTVPTETNGLQSNG